MDLKQLGIFLAIVEEGGFNRASAKHYISQSAVSRRIKMLEDELGLKLFHRVGRRAVLTPEGKSLVHQSRLIFRQVRMAKVQLSETVLLQRGEIRIGTGIGHCTSLLPRPIALIHRKYPNVQLRVMIGSTEELLTSVREGQIDLAVLTLPINSTNLEIAKILREEMVAIVGRGHFLSHRRTIKFSDLLDLPYLTIDKNAKSRRILDNAFQKLGVVPRVEMELTSFMAVKPFVEINLGYSIVPRTEIQSEVAAGRLHVLRVRGLKIHRETGLVHLKSAHLPRLVAEIIKSISASHRRAGN